MLCFLDFDDFFPLFDLSLDLLLIDEKEFRVLLYGDTSGSFEWDLLLGLDNVKLKLLLRACRTLSRLELSFGAEAFRDNFLYDFLDLFELIELLLKLLDREFLDRLDFLLDVPFKLEESVTGYVIMIIFGRFSFMHSRSLLVL